MGVPHSTHSANKLSKSVSSAELVSDRLGFVHFLMFLGVGEARTARRCGSARLRSPG